MGEFRREDEVFFFSQLQCWKWRGERVRVRAETGKKKGTGTNGNEKMGGRRGRVERGEGRKKKGKEKE